MRKFIIKAFQEQKRYLPFKLKEKSANYLKSFQKVGKHLPNVKTMKKAITRKQNQHLSSAQKIVISFVYNFVWKRISRSFLDLITPSIIKSNQLTKVTDYRNQVELCQGADLIPESRGETDLKCQSLSKYIHFRKKVIKCNSLCNTENKFLSSSSNEKSCEVDKKYQSKSGISSSVHIHSIQLDENGDKNANLVVSPNKGSLIPDLDCLDKNGSSLNDMNRNCCKEYTPHLSNNTRKSSKSILDSIKSSNVNSHNSSKIPDKSNKNQYQNKYHKKKTTNGLPKGSKSNQTVDTNLSTNTSVVLNNMKEKISNEQISSIDRQRTNKKLGAKLVVKDDNVPMKGRDSLKIRTTRNNELYVSLTQSGYANEIQDSSLDGKEFPKSVNRMDLKQDSLQKHIIEDEKSKPTADDISNIVIQQEAGDRVHISNESNNNRIKTNKGTTKENSNFSKMQNKTSFLQNKLFKTNKAIQSKPSAFYKKKKRKASFERKLILQTQATKDFNRSNLKKGKLSVLEDCKLDDSMLPLTETYKRKSDIIKTYLQNKENPALKSCEQVNQDYIRLTDETVNTPETVKSSLVVFDTTQDEAQIVQEQSVGSKISNIIDLNKVIRDENVYKASKKSNVKTKNPVRNNQVNNKKVKSKMTDYKNIKPATSTPWKRNKDTSVESRNSTMNDNTSSNKEFDSVISTHSKNYDKNPETKKTDVAESNRLTNSTSFSTTNVSMDSKVDKKPLGKTLSLNNMHSKNEQESLFSKKTTSMESFSLKTSLPTKNQMLEVKDINTSKLNYLNKESQSGRTKTLSKKAFSDTKAAVVSYEKKTGNANENELNNKNDKVVSEKQQLDTARKLSKEKNSIDNSNRTKNLNYQSTLIRPVKRENAHLSPKESNAVTVSSTKLAHVSPLIIGNSSKKEKKLENQTQLQEVGTCVAEPKTSTLLTFSNTDTKLESKSNAHLFDKNKTKSGASFQNSVSLSSKPSLKSINKNRLEYNDRLLSKTVADISQGLDKIPGKDEFKIKMNQLLYSFTVTGQKQQATNVKRQIKSQEGISTKNEKENKSNKSLESGVNKSMSNEELNIKLKNYELKNKKSSSAKDPISNKKTADKNNVPGNNCVKENILVGKPKINSLSVSVRPALGVPKGRSGHENTIRSGEKHVQRRSVAKTITIISSSKVKTVISNKSEPKNVGTICDREVKQHTTDNSSLKEDKRILKSTTPANNVDSFASKEMLRKLGKRRPSE